MSAAIIESRCAPPLGSGIMPSTISVCINLVAVIPIISAASDALAESGDNRDTWEADNERIRKREVFEHRKKHEKEFSKAWDLMNIEQWKKNQQTGKLRKLKESKEISDYETRRRVHFQSANDDARSTTYESINAFDERLRKEVFREDPQLTNTLGASLKKTVQGSDGMGMPTLEYTDQKFLDQGLNLALKTMKEHHETELGKIQVHDRRRRKFVRERENSVANILRSAAQDENCTTIIKSK